MSPSKTIMDVGYDVPAISQYLDWINVMTYDYHGQWDKKTGHVAPHYAHPDDEFYYFNAVSPRSPVLMRPLTSLFRTSL